MRSPIDVLHVSDCVEKCRNMLKRSPLKVRTISAKYNFKLPKIYVKNGNIFIVFEIFTVIHFYK